MQKSKFHCDNRLCKYNEGYWKCNKSTRCLAPEVHIGLGYIGKHLHVPTLCSSFQPNLQYYLVIACMALEKTNIIFLSELNDDLRIGLYVVAQIYGLKVCTYESRGFMTLINPETDQAVDWGDIEELKSNSEEHTRLAALVDPLDLKENGLEKLLQEAQQKPEEDSSTAVERKYGWLAPTGKFIESPWGTHDDTAHEIIDGSPALSKAFDSIDNDLGARDFLVESGYCLIHDPSNISYYVQEPKRKNITKAQREFLFDYFTDVGFKDMAYKYVSE